MKVQLTLTFEAMDDWEVPSDLEDYLDESFPEWEMDVVITNTGDDDYDED